MSVPSAPLEQNVLNDLVSKAKDWAVGHGFVVRTVEHKDKSDVCQIFPFALLPSRFPRPLFQQAIDIQKDMNTLYFRASFDRDFIESSLHDVVKSDDFTANLLSLYLTVMDEGIGQPLVLQLQRSDYMCHSPDGSFKSCALKQIEVNNIATAMGTLASRVTQLHRIMLSELGYSQEAICKYLPKNSGATTIASGLAEAWWAYRQPTSLILFVVENVNQNAIDQRHLEYALWDLTDAQVKVIRLTMTECFYRLSIDETNRLLLDDKEEIAVVYFRAGYLPDQYFSDKEWTARKIIECSKAIKSPWIGLQLANTKKIQQTLSEPGVVEKYLESNQDRACKVRATFAGLWGLEVNCAQTDNLVSEACANPHKYVLKPQLEGGGFNIYGDEIPKRLNSLDGRGKAAYILMEKLEPLKNRNYLVRAFSPVELIETVSELGIYGYLLGDLNNNGIRRNVASGCMVRTKPAGVDEGGILAGAAFLDSPFLV